MRKKVLAILMTCVVVCSAWPSMGVAAAAQEGSKAVSMENTVYVSTDGRAMANGTYEDPFGSIREATESLEGKTDAENPGMIYIRGGIYRIPDSIRINSDNNYVTFAAYQDEEVKISGSVTLDNQNFKKLSQVSAEQYSSGNRLPESMREEVYVYDLKEQGIPAGAIQKNGFNWPQKPYQPELVVDGNMQMLAKYPNEGYLDRNTILAGCSGFKNSADGF